jgi:hypothetical protein
MKFDQQRWEKMSNFIFSAKSQFETLADFSSQHVSQAYNKLWTDKSTSSSISNEIDSPKLGKTSSESFGRLDGDLILKIMFYLEPDEVCKYRRVNKFVQYIFQKYGEQYWKLIDYSKYKVKGLIDNQSKYYSQYLFFATLRYETEYKHAKSMENYYDALACYCAKNASHGNYYAVLVGTVGMVCDVFWLNDERVALTLSKNRYYALPTIIVENEAYVYDFKKAVSHIKNSPSSFLPINVATEGVTNLISEYQYLNGSNLDIIPGCLGFATNLFQMKPEHEYLRYSVLAMLFKNLLVFETVEAKESYIRTLNQDRIRSFQGVALDEYDLDQLTNTYPRFAVGGSRPCYYRDYKFKYPESIGGSSGSDSGSVAGLSHEKQLNSDYVQMVITDLKTSLENMRHSYTVVRYSY